MLHKIFFFALAIVFLSGCVVSKKKYETLLAQKNKLSGELQDEKDSNKKLSKDLKSAVTDYEAMRYKMGKSNAIKSDEISDLMIQVTALQTKADDLNAELQSTLKAYSSNKQSGLQTAQELEKVQKQLRQLKRDTAGLHYSIKLAKERNSLIREELSNTKQKVNTSYKELSSVKAEARKKDVQFKTMETQLLEQKQIIESISKTFIELRKQLLSAKGNNAPIDPNKNKNVDKIARLLGHY